MRKDNQDRPELCNFTYADGRRCTMPQFPDDMGLCYHHGLKRQEFLNSREAGRRVSQFLHTDILTACDLSRTLSALFSATAQGYMKPKVASCPAYLGHLMLQTQRLAKEEFLETFENKWPEVVLQSPSFAPIESNPQPHADDAAPAPIAASPTTSPNPAANDSDPSESPDDPSPSEEDTKVIH